MKPTAIAITEYTWLSFFLILLIGVTGCNVQSDSEQQDDMMDKLQTDIKALAKLVVLDPQPTSAEWSVAELPGGSDWTLIAILSYPEDIQDNLIKSMEKKSSGELKIDIPDWVPEDVRSTLGIENGNILAGGTYDPTPYLSSPLLQGFLLPVAGDQIFLYLATQ